MCLIEKKILVANYKNKKKGKKQQTKIDNRLKLRKCVKKNKIRKNKTTTMSF